MAPPKSHVRPVSITAESGDVTNAGALIAPSGHGTTVLTWTGEGAHPTIIVDYGKDIGGIPYFVVSSQRGSPDLRSSYSEGRQYVGPNGDNTPSGTNAGDSSRVVTLRADSPGTLSNGLIQGGERYEEITLASPGSVTLSSIGIRFTAVRAVARDYRGWFASSSNELNQIWYDGAYTDQLVELPAATLPSAWRVVDGALVNDGGLAGMLHRGTHWTNYSASFDAKVVRGDVGWMVRSRSTLTGYFIFLDDAKDTAGPPNSLREFAVSPTSLTLIADVHLRAPIAAGSWHRIRSVARGATITTTIDGRRVATFDAASLPSGAPAYVAGSFGFVEYSGQEAQFRNLDVSAPNRTTLYADSLGHPGVLTNFSGPEVESGVHRPAIMDGAKRDREVWSADLGVEGTDVFYTTDSDTYVKDSLQLLGSYQSANGEAGAQVSPTAPLGSFPESNATFSTSYSMDEVVNIANYYLYTGDLAFVRSEWPMITRELRYNRSLVDSRGLLTTNDTNGLDWDYYDGSKSGAVTAYNDIYYETLINAATMAQALGRREEAATYRLEAADLRSSINRYLFDPTLGLYVTSDLMPTSIAQDGNALAILDGVTDGSTGDAVLSKLRSTLPTTPYGPLPFSTATGYRAAVSPFVSNEEVEAEFASGETPSALSLLQTVWGHMDAPGPDDTGTDWELVGENGSPGFGAYTSLAHGWSSGATADLSAYVLGVRPTDAGYAKWLVQPHPGSLSWVEGDVPTPQGTIAVRWAQQPASGDFTLQVSAPTRSKGTISVPVPSLGGLVTVRISNGKALRSIKSPAGATYQSVPVTGGQTYRIDVTPLSGRHR